MPSNPDMSSLRADILLVAVTEAEVKSALRPATPYATPILLTMVSTKDTHEAATDPSAVDTVVA